MSTNLGSLTPKTRAGFDAVTEALFERFLQESDNTVRIGVAKGGPVRAQDLHQKLQSGLCMLAQHRPEQVAHALERWRHVKVKEAADGTMQLSQLTRKNLAIDIVYMGTMLKLLDQRIAIPPPSATTLQELVFQFVLHRDRLMPQAELGEQKEQLISLCHQLLGALSRLRIVAIAKAFYSHLDDRKNGEAHERGELQALCDAMQHMHLAFGNDRELDESTQALQLLHPLHPAMEKTKKKSQIYYMVCNVLANVLRGAANEGLPRVNRHRLTPAKLQLWYRKVDDILKDLWTWLSKKSKHTNAGYPAATQLLRISIQNNSDGHGSYGLTHFDEFVKALHQMFKEKVWNKAHRTLGLTCMVQCVHAYLQNWQQKSDANNLRVLEENLDRIVAPIIASGNRGTFNSSPNQLRQMQHLCVLSMPFTPSYVVTRLIVPLLGSEQWQCTIVGLHATMQVMLQAVQRLSDAPVLQLELQGLEPETDKEDDEESEATNGQALESTAGGSMLDDLGVDLHYENDEHMLRALDLIRRGSHPIALYPLAAQNLHLALSKPIGRVWDRVWKMHAHRLMNRPSNSGDAQANRQYILTMNALLATLRLTPLVRPDCWAVDDGETLAGSLAQLTIHTREVVRFDAQRAQLRYIKGWPQYRNLIVREQCKLLRRMAFMSDTVTDVVQHVLRMLLYWHACLLRDMDMQDVEQNLALPPVDLASFEGFGISLLCSPLPEVRTLGLKILEATRKLHRAASLAAMGAMEHLAYAVSVLEQVGDPMLSQHYWKFGKHSFLMKDRPAEEDSFLNMLKREADALRWAAMLPRLIPHLQAMCPAVVSSAYKQVSAHLTATLTSTSSRHLTVPLDSSNPLMDMWRVCLAFLAACPPYQSGEKSAVISGEELRKHLLSTLKDAVEGQVDAVCTACGVAHLSHLPHLLQPLVSPGGMFRLSLEKNSMRSSTRRLLRVVIAHIVRQTAEGLPTGYLTKNPDVAELYSGFLLDVCRSVSTRGLLAPENDCIEIWYCACIVVQCIVQQGNSDMMPLPVRHTLWDACNKWARTVDDSRKSGSSTDSFWSAFGDSSTRLRGRDPEERAAAMQDIRHSREALQIASFQARAALLSGPLWDDTMHKMDGVAFRWFDWALVSSQPRQTDLLGVSPPPCVAAQNALRELLLSSPELCFICLNCCYGSDGRLTTAYFRVFVDVCETLHSLGNHSALGKPHQLLALVLHYVGHPDASVRGDALLLLRVVMEVFIPRSPITQDIECGVVVLGQLQDSYHKWQVEVSERLAEQNAGLSEQLCLELLKRQRDMQELHAQRQVFHCLKPWLRNILLEKSWRGNWSEQLLKLLFGASSLHIRNFPEEIRDMWHTAVIRPENVGPVVDFVLHAAMNELNEANLASHKDSLYVAKLVMLFCCQQAPQSTVDELMVECAQLISKSLLVTTGPANAEVPLELFSYKGPNAVLMGLSDAANSTPSVEMSLASPTTTRSAVNMLLCSDKLTSTGDAPGFEENAVRSAATNATTQPMSIGGAMSIGGGRTFGLEPTHSRRMSFESSAPSKSRHGRWHTRDTSGLSFDDFGIEVPVPVGGPLQREEITLCMLSELSFRHIETFREQQKLPLLLLTCIIKVDSTLPAVYMHAHQILVNVVYTLVASNLQPHAVETMTDRYTLVTSVIEELQSATQLWPSEVTAFNEPYSVTYPVLKRLVQHLVECMLFEPGLQNAWREEALHWALHVCSLQVALRCMHVLRALGPKLDPPTCNALLSAATQCHLRPSCASFDFLAEILICLKEMVERCGLGEIKQCPQLVWAVVSLLQTSNVPVFALVLDVMHALLSNLQLWNLPCQQILDAAAPQPNGDPSRLAPAGCLDLSAWKAGCYLTALPHLSCVQQLLWPGLLRESTHTQTVRVLALMLRQLAGCFGVRGATMGMTLFTPSAKALVKAGGSFAPAGDGMDRLFGKCSTQLVACLIGGLPWVLSHRHEAQHHELVHEFCAAAASACKAYGATELAPRISAFGKPDTSEPLSRDAKRTHTLLNNFAKPFITAFFPAHASLVLVFCTLMLVVGPKSWHVPLLMLLSSIYQAPNLSLGRFGRSELHTSILQTLVILVEGEDSSHVIALLDMVMSFVATSVDHAGTLGRPSHSNQAIRKLPLEMIPVRGLKESCIAVAASMKHCLEGVDSKSGAYYNHILPFL